MTDYSTIKALNWSSLKHILRSPKYFRWRVDHPEPRKLAFLLGGAIHAKVLEPDTFDSRYALCLVRRDGRTEAYQEWMCEHPGAEPLNAKEMEVVLGAAAAVRDHREARELLDGCRHEEPLVWDDPDTGLACKGRLDAINSELVIDLKMARNIAEREFAAAAARYGYHAQLAGFYHAGAVALRKIDGKIPPKIIAVEPEPPHDVAIYQLSFDDMQAGRNLVVSLMRRYQECMASDYWPGAVPSLTQLQLPSWAPGFIEESEDW